MLILAGFPGVGKTHLQTRLPGVHEVDDESFRWMPLFTKATGPQPNPGWPQNYLDHVRFLMAEPGVRYILVSTQQDVRDALVAAEIPFTLVYPEESTAKAYIQQYGKQHPGGLDLEALKANYRTLAAQKNCTHLVLGPGLHLADLLVPPTARFRFTVRERATIEMAYTLLQAQMESKVGGSLIHNLHKALEAAKTEAHNSTEAKAWVVRAFLKGFEDAADMPARNLDGLSEWWLRGILAGLGYYARSLHLDDPAEHLRVEITARASNTALLDAVHRHIKEVAKATLTRPGGPSETENGDGTDL